MPKPTAQQCHALTTYFITAYTAERGKAPTVNRNSARWGFESVLMDYTAAQAKDMIDHYVHKSNDPSLTGFLYSYDKVDLDMQADAEEKVSQAKRRKSTAAAVERYRKQKQAMEELRKGQHE